MILDVASTLGYQNPQTLGALTPTSKNAAANESPQRSHCHHQKEIPSTEGKLNTGIISVIQTNPCAEESPHTQPNDLGSASSLSIILQLFRMKTKLCSEISLINTKKISIYF